MIEWFSEYQFYIIDRFKSLELAQGLFSSVFSIIKSIKEVGLL